MAAIGSGGTIGAIGTYEIGSGVHSSAGGTVVVQLASNAFVGSVTVKARVRDAAAAPWVAIAYYNVNTGARATAAITGAATITIPASGLETQLDCTAFTSGSLTVYIAPVRDAVSL